MEEYYTTTQAAKKLSVSADTVLKWVKAGKIDSYRTPGGHFRIPIKAVVSILPGHTDVKNQNDINNSEEFTHLYCWDFYSQSGCVVDDCQNCIAFKSRARRCYEMRDIPEEFGHLKLHCKTDCSECDYFNLMSGSSTSVLIVSHSEKLIRDLDGHKKEKELILRFAKSGYECGMLIDKFRPDYVIIDYGFGETRARDICQNLTNDERIPFTRVLLTSRTTSMNGFCEGKVFGWIRKPFTYSQLKECLSHEELLRESK